MKRVFAFIMVLAILFSLSVNAFAAGETESTPNPETGSITITNATVGETYSLYKIFDATYSTTKDAEGNDVAGSVAYTLHDQKIVEYMFPNEATENIYFNYDPVTGAVTKKASAVDSDLIAYLTTMVKDTTLAMQATATKKADAATVAFSNVPYGYYMVISSLGATVTINSNTPNAEVIDKNQQPAHDFKKEIATAFDAAGKPTAWGTSNSANIGDKLFYKVSWTGTNYDGAHQIMYYQMHDKSGNAVCIDYSSMNITLYYSEERENEAGELETVTLSKPLTKGYYICMEDTSKNAYTGNWGDAAQNMSDVEWYLVDLGANEFRVTFPWMDSHTATPVVDQSSGKITSYTLTFPEGAKSDHRSPVRVEMYYTASLAHNATVGVDVSSNNTNTASLSWTSAHDIKSTATHTVNTLTYGLGLIKDDAATAENLAGAEFRLFSDANCTVPVNVIPTDLEGVYVVDSLGRFSETNHPDHATRTVFAQYLNAYLNGKAQDNLVVSQINGKLAILGLEAGDYYLQEVKAPAGYNALAAAQKLTAGEAVTPFYIYADSEGKVADIQTPDATHSEYILYLTSTTVHNSKGVELPSTGGMGTMMMVGFGSFLVILFAIFLITQKKMSIYRD